MKSRLYVKFILVYFIFGSICFITIATLSSRLTMNYLEKTTAEELYREANHLCAQYMDKYYEGGDSLEGIHEQMENIAIYLSASVWLVSPEGQILMNSERALHSSYTEQIDNFSPFSGDNNYYQIGTYNGMFEEPMLSVTSSVTSDFQNKGYFILHVPMSLLTQKRDNFLNTVYITMGVMFILSLGILWVFRVIVFKPLKEITKATGEYAGGNLNYQIPISSRDEIGQLCASLNYMSSELGKNEDYQKKFIANVSHDFRSPLTSIKGYVQAILDGTIPPEMHEKYLNIVLFEAERLHKLTESLLALNDFDRKGLLLDITDFDINEIIRKTAASFEGTCTAKKITIELVLMGKALFVKADMGKIQQVLYNLIDNAIKFSNRNSSIKLETTEKNEKLFVSVKDSGIGIPKDSLNKVWDRFYKTDPSRGKDKKGTGLGLCIVKEIIQAHNENIDVISTEGVGSEFIFTLTKSKNQPKE